MAKWIEDNFCSGNGTCGGTSSIQASSAVILGDDFCANSGRGANNTGTEVQNMIIDLRSLKNITVDEYPYEYTNFCSMSGINVNSAKSCGCNVTRTTNCTTVYIPR